MHRGHGLSGCAAAGWLAVASVLGFGTAPAQGFPERPITLIVPAPPGGGTDVFARKLAELAEPILKQKIVVENRAGDGGALGTSQVISSRPDGHTLGLVWNGPLTIGPHTRQTTSTPDRYRALLQIGYAPYVLCALPEFPARNAKQLVAYLQANPGKYTYGSDGPGGMMQLAAGRIFSKLDVKVRPVSFAGAGETAINFLGGHVTFYGGSLPPILPHIKAGKAKCLLLTTAGDHPALPEASGLNALGIASEETLLWWGLIAPNGIPPDRLKTLTAAFHRAATDPHFRETMAYQGATFALKDGPAMERAVREELAALGAVAKAIGLDPKP
jgi:tripartite-type tricarboxylate transporter receptor subunit TctC